MQKTVLVMFGGISAEHEVSVVTGLQALENLDQKEYSALPIYVNGTGEYFAMPKLRVRKDFLKAARLPVSFGRDHDGGYVEIGSRISKKVYPYSAFLAFHGGLGEGGASEGLLEAVGIPFTSSGIEGSVIAMNKKLTKEALQGAGVATVPDVRFFANTITTDAAEASKHAVAIVGLPAIIKPVHLGSSIGINIARSEIELEKGLREAAFSDNEIIVEPFLEGITEFNCAVRRTGSNVEASPIERPISHDAILSFADKYERGAKKSGGGMASLTRELPAKISIELTEQIQEMARKAFVACRMKGMARIDFMQDSKGTVFLTEINSIPGSMAYYLWEAAGMPYQQQITDLIEQSVVDMNDEVNRRPQYHSDIIERFVKG